MYIAGPNGEIDWIITDPEIDFNEIFAQFDTLLVGRRTFEEMVKTGQTSIPGTKIIVFSKTLRAEDHPGFTLISQDQRAIVSALKAQPGKDIWLFGGGSLFRSLAEDGLVDTVEIAIIPVMLGAGTPLMSRPAKRINMSLTSHKIYKSGIVALEYAISKGV